MSSTDFREQVAKILYGHGNDKEILDTIVKLHEAEIERIIGNAKGIEDNEELKEAIHRALTNHEDLIISNQFKVLEVYKVQSFVADLLSLVKDELNRAAITPTQPSPEFDQLTNRDEWQGKLDGLNITPKGKNFTSDEKKLFPQTTDTIDEILEGDKK